MKITLAESAGFCFGVSRAVENVYDLTLSNENGRIYTVGSLIHNKHLTSELEEKGVRVIDESNFAELANSANENDPCTVVIRTHGVAKNVTDTLEEYRKKNQAFHVCDLTCPYVKKIHKIVSESDSDILIVFGDENHPEVKGIVSYFSGETKVISDPNEILNIDFGEKSVTMVAQTTQNTNNWKKTQKNLKKVCTNSKIFDTICRVTENRQSEARELAKASDAVLVVGCKDSSNTNKLFDISKKLNENTFFIESPTELNYICFTPFSKVGITAGASTPSGIIQEVIKLMSDFENKNTVAEESAEMSFEEMLEGSLKTLNTGDMVTGVITSVSAGELHVDLGTKVTGIIAYDEVTDDSSLVLTDAFKPGDEIKAVVVKVSDRDGVATLSKKRIDNKLRFVKLLNAYNEDAVIEGTVCEVIKGGVLLNYEGNRVFVPASQTGVAKDGDLNTLLGTVQKARIIEIKEDKKRAVASIRKVKNEERKALEEAFWASVEVGKQYEGAVKSITSYGAFVDLGGVDGMVHKTELSWTRIKNPSEVVSVGDVIKVFVKDIDAENKRISLGYKTEEGNPWNVFTSKYALGDVAEVRIVSLMPFGAFAEVLPGVDGLIHIYQITDKKIASPADVLKVGDIVKAEIIGIDEENHKISLSMRTLIEKTEEPADEANEEVAE